jgi:hypothetical protein
MVRSVSQGARREIRHAVVFSPKGQPMQKDVSKATRGWAVLSTTSNSRGPAGATSLFEDSIVAGERNRVEGAEGALNVTARPKTEPQISRASRADRFALGVHHAIRTHFTHGMPIALIQGTQDLRGRYHRGDFVGAARFRGCRLSFCRSCNDLPVLRTVAPPGS